MPNIFQRFATRIRVRLSGSAKAANTAALADFQKLAAERVSETNDHLETHDYEYFGQMDFEFTPSDVLGMESMAENLETRVNMARLYMYAKGCSLDDIYGNTPEAREKREIYGQEFGDMFFPDDFGEMNMNEDLGRALADMGKAIAGFTMPDVSSDTALVRNAREINFMQAAAHFTQCLSEITENSPRKTEVLTAYREAMGPEAIARLDKAAEAVKATQSLSVNDRLAFIASDGYTQSPTDKVAAMEALHYSQSRPLLRSELRPGIPLSAQSPDSEKISASRAMLTERNQGMSVNALYKATAASVPMDKAAIQAVTACVNESKTKASAPAVDVPRKEMDLDELAPRTAKEAKERDKAISKQLAAHQKEVKKQNEATKKLDEAIAKHKDKKADGPSR